MAAIASQNLTITVSKLVKSGTESSVLTVEQIETLLDSLPSLIEQLIEDNSLVVEVDVM
jgi:hypothetical protein